MNLSVIVPAYNEEQAILDGKLYPVYQWCQKYHGTELIIVDDGSTDDTAMLARIYPARVIGIQHAGKAAAIIAGIQSAAGRLILFTDMDQATPISEADYMLLHLCRGADVVIGSRGARRAGAPLSRKVMSWGQMALRSIFLGLDLTDTQCGFKAFSRSAALDIIEHLVIYHPRNLQPTQHPNVSSGFDVEFLFVARQLGYRIEEVPVKWTHQATGRVNLFRDATRGIADLAKITLQRWQGAYSHRGTNEANRYAETNPFHRS